MAPGWPAAGLEQLLVGEQEAVVEASRSKCVQPQEFRKKKEKRLQGCLRPKCIFQINNADIVLRFLVQNEEVLKKCAQEYLARVKQEEQRYQTLKLHAEEKLDKYVNFKVILPSRPLRAQNI